MTPMQLLDELIDSPSDVGHAVWREFEQASKGKRQITWSKGLKRWVKEEAKEEVDSQSDAEIAVSPSKAEPILRVIGGWHRAARRQNELLEAFEAGGVAEAGRWLDELGVTWLHVSEEENIESRK